MAISKILDFSAGSKFAIKLSQDIIINNLLDMTEKVKTVIEFYFLLPDFKSRGHPNQNLSVLDQNRKINQRSRTDSDQDLRPNQD